MTTNIKLIIFTFGTLFLFLSYSSNPPNGKTGAPGENTCNQCHTGNNTALDGELTITGLPSSVDANTTYPLTITLTNPNGVAVRGGFQWVAIDENNSNAGDIDNASMGSALMLQSGREYHEHNGSNFFSGTPLTWTSDWTAPNLPQGTEVTLHAAGVIGNGTGSANDRVRVISETTTVNASNTPLAITLSSQTDPLCYFGNDGTATLSVTGGTPPYFFDWDNNEDTNPAVQLTEGDTSVEVSDSNGNSLDFTVTLDEPSEIVIDEIENNSPICLNGLNGTAEVEASGGTPPFQYSWSDGQTGPIGVNLVAGSYTVQAEDENGCIENISVTITEEGLPVTIEGDTEYCEGTSLTLIASPGFNTYSWNTGDLVDTITINSPGTYNVVVSDSIGCSGIDYITINEIATTPFTILGPTEICPGIEEELSTSVEYDSYLWSDSTTLATLTIDTCGTYSVIVTDSLGCEQLETISINCTGDLDIILIENSPVTCIGDCDGILEAGLATSGGASGSWSTGSTANRITDLCPGSYTYTVVDNTGCSASQTYEVVEPLPIELTIDTIIPPICYIDTTSFIAVHAVGGVSPYTYFWPEGMTGDTITEFDSGIYQVTIVDNNNCVDSFQVTVPDVLPLIVVVEEVIDVQCHGESTGQIITSAIGGHGGYQFQWSTGSTENDIFNLPSDTYALTITDTLGCSETKLIPVFESDLVTYTANTIGESETGANDGTISLSVVGGSGNYNYVWDNGDTTSEIENLVPGVYTCIVTDEFDCQLTLTETINEGGCLIAMSTLVTHIDCFGDNDGSISVEVVNGIPPFEIEVLDSDGETQEANQLTAGVYSVSVEDSAGCVIQDQLTVNQPTELEISIEVISISTCDDIQDGQAEAIVIGGVGPYQYEWTTGSTESTTPLGSQSAGVIITDSKGCQISAGITTGYEDTISPEVILQPLTQDFTSNGGFLIPNPSDFDAGSSDNCGNLTFTYEYEPVVVCGTATYNVEILVTDEANNTTVGMTTLTVRDIDAPVISCPANINVAFCQEVVYEVSAIDNCGEEVILTLINGLESQSEFPVGTTLVTYQAIDNSNNVANCEFNVTRRDEYQLSVSTEDVSCFGASDGKITIDDNGISYTEVLANGEEKLDSLPAGDYTVTTIDSDGCINNLTVTLNEPTAISLNINSVTNETIVDGNDGSFSTSINGGIQPYQIAWYLDGVLTEYLATDLNDLTPGSYHAIIIDNNGCEYTSEDIVIEEKVSSSVEDIDSKVTSLRARPNPAYSNVTFSLESPENTRVNMVVVYTLQGKIVTKEMNPLDLTLDIGGYQNGIYITKVVTETKSYSVRWSKL